MEQKSWCVVTYVGDRVKMVTPALTFAEAETAAARFREMLDDRIEIIPAFEGLALKRQMTESI